jgi:hypothetical protein
MSLLQTPQSPLEQPAPSLRVPSGGCPVWNGLGRRPVGFWLLERQIHWYGVHYVDRRCLPCLKSVGRCAPCEDAWLPRRVGYICAMHARTGGRYLLRITETAYRSCPVLALRSADFRAIPVIMLRLGEAKCSAWKIEIPAVKMVPPLPPAVDVVQVLSLLWGIDLARVSACPPIDGDLTPQLRPYRPKQRRQL